MALCYYEAEINKLTNAALDPAALISEFKYCAVRVSIGGAAPAQHRQRSSHPRDR